MQSLIYRYIYTLGTYIIYILIVNSDYTFALIFTVCRGCYTRYLGTIYVEVAVLLLSPQTNKSKMPIILDVVWVVSYLGRSTYSTYSTSYSVLY